MKTIIATTPVEETIPLHEVDVTQYRYRAVFYETENDISRLTCSQVGTQFEWHFQYLLNPSSPGQKVFASKSPSKTIEMALKTPDIKRKIMVAGPTEFRKYLKDYLNRKA